MRGTDSTRDRVFEVNWHWKDYKHYLNQVSYHHRWRQIYSNSAKILKDANSFQQYNTQIEDNLWTKWWMEISPNLIVICNQKAQKRWTFL
jgi:hypothetical protein